MKSKCNYCNGYTKDDMRGNCSSCGAPRRAEGGYVRQGAKFVVSSPCIIGERGPELFLPSPDKRLTVRSSY